MRVTYDVPDGLGDSTDDLRVIWLVRAVLSPLSAQTKRRVLNYLMAGYEDRSAEEAVRGNLQ